MRILLTNSFMAACTGSEMAAFDMARGLKRLGHEVGFYAPVMSGRWRRSLAMSGIEAADRTDQLSFRPTIIHGQHVVAFVSCMKAFPEASVVQWIHDLSDPVDAPVLHSSIAAHVAVDKARAARAREAGCTNVHVVPNAVDLERFPILPIPEGRRALCIVKRTGLGDMIDKVTRACEHTGWHLTCRGAGVGDEVEDIARAYVEYPLVITSGRCALEAVAMGRSVIVCDYGRLSGLVGPTEWDRMRAANFGLNAMQHPLDDQRLAELLRSVDVQAGHAFAAGVRSTIDLDTVVRQVEGIYTRIARTHAPLESPSNRAQKAEEILALAEQSSAVHLEHWRRVAATRN